MIVATLALMLHAVLTPAAAAGDAGIVDPLKNTLLPDAIFP